MPITEAPMRPGFGTVNLIPDTPLSIHAQIVELILGTYDGLGAWVSGGEGGHVVITKVPMDPSLGDAAMLAGALYPPQRITARPAPTQIDFTGPSAWLDSTMEATVSKTAGTPTQWATSLLLNGLSVGTVSGGNNVTAELKAYAQTYRQGLDLIAEMGGWEYDVRPDFTVNVGPYADLFQSPPKIVITNRAEGDDGTYTGLLGTIPGPNIDASNAATKVIAVGQGDGASVVYGSASHTITLKDQDGNTPTLVQTINAPSQTSTGASTVATNVLPAFESTVKSITVSTGERRGPSGTFGAVKPKAPGGKPGPGSPGGGSGTKPGDTDGVYEHRRLSKALAQMALGRTGNRRGFSAPSSESEFVRSKLRPGDEVYVYDLEAGILDPANQITYRGETISPALLRVTMMTSPIERGYGVYIRSNAATPTYIDLTPFVQWEAPGTQIEVSDWTPASYGQANRSDPAVEQRIATRAAEAVSSVTVNQSGTVANTVNYGTLIRHAAGTFDLFVRTTFSASGTAANGIVLTLPITLVDAEAVGGDFEIDAATGSSGRVSPLSTTTVRFKADAGGIVGINPAITLANTNVLRVHITGRYA